MYSKDILRAHQLLFSKCLFERIIYLRTGTERKMVLTLLKVWKVKRRIFLLDNQLLVALGQQNEEINIFTFSSNKNRYVTTTSDHGLCEKFHHNISKINIKVLIHIISKTYNKFWFYSFFFLTIE